MKITGLKTWVVANPPPRAGGRYFIFVRLETDNGIVGYGEVYAATFSPAIVVKMIEDVYARHVDGIDPFAIEAMWRKVYARGYSMRPDISLVGVLSGLEIALWDICGKALDRPVYDLLGGRVHERLRTYTYLYPESGDVYADDPVYTDPDAAAERALEYLRQGFTAIKFDPAGSYSVYDPRQPAMADLSRCEAFCKTLREAVGDRADLLFGTHGQFTTAGAIRMARRLEPYEPLWFEEPVPPEMPEEMARVAQATSVPIATGERLTTRFEFARVLDTGAASILQMATGRVGGIGEARKIAVMAETRYAQIAPHLYCGPIEGAANAQVAFASANFLILESIERWGGFHGQVLKSPMPWQDGCVLAPGAPGIGVELDEQVCEANPYQGDELHLNAIEDHYRAW